VKQEKQDRRSRRTRQLVQSAMMELLQEKRYEEITVRDILNRANIGSSTFYAHYFDKEDVQASLIEQWLEQFHQQLAQRNASQDIIPSLELFRHVQEHFQRFQALVRGHAEEQIWEIAYNALSTIIEQALESACAEKHSPSIPPAVVSQYLAGAYLSLLKWWIAAEMPYSPERMDEIFRQLALPGVWSTVGGKRK
jgi:AcrR family transcriptional regulator